MLEQYRLSYREIPRPSPPTKREAHWDNEMKKRLVYLLLRLPEDGHPRQTEIHSDHRSAAQGLHRTRTEISGEQQGSALTGSGLAPVRAADFAAVRTFRFLITNWSRFNSSTATPGIVLPDI